MSDERIHPSAAFFRPLAGAETDPVRSVVAESPLAAVVCWCVLPGQALGPHVHPTGQDTWVVLQGQGSYVLDAEGTTRPVRAGDVVIAPSGAVHGVRNTGTEPLHIVAVVSPSQAGFEPVDLRRA